MPLNPGQKLGPYEIESPVGAGGMGEVYKANDSRLDRIVAIKVLPTATAHNADLRSRFEREAKAISSLNHPNICTLFDVGHEGGIDYLVMEYIEGETLSDRIKRGAFDFRQAYEIAIQISDALDTAHHRGLVHRDLKPANVMLTKSGAKLLDFGLAKLKVSDGVVEGASATQTTPLTGTGTIIGTLQYMAPEQLEGKPADPRSDVFAFGAMLHEMVTGQKAFEGKSQASLIAAIMEKEPISISSIKPMSPPSLDRLVHKCLEKDPDKRWQSARDLSDELKWIAQSGSQAGVSSAISAKRRFRFKLAWVVATISSLIAIATLGWILTRPKPDVFARQFRIEVSPKLVWAGWPQISPDGRYVAYLAQDSSNTTMIWIRPLNSLESYSLLGTENASRPFWSPDSKNLAFTTGGSQLKKTSITGGLAQLLGESSSISDGSWGNSGIILLDGGTQDSIRAISASGGQVTAATFIDHKNGERFHAWPQFLSDGRHFLYLASKDTLRANSSYELKVGSLDSKESRFLMNVNTLVRYSQDGYILFIRDKILLSQRFDEGKLKLVGEPVPITDKVRMAGMARANFCVSNEGTLVLQTQGESQQTAMKWFDRAGRELATVGEPGQYVDATLSPKESKIAYVVNDEKNNNYDIWIHDLDRNVSSRLTFDPENEFFPVWTPDGNQIVYFKGALPKMHAYSKLADGSTDATKSDWSDSLWMFVTDISSDGSKYCNTLVSGSQADVVVFPPKGDTSAASIANSKYLEYDGQFSPDGKFIAYVSQESGKQETYVKQADGKGGKWQVSLNGGTSPAWRSDGLELFYWGLDSYLMAVPVNTKNGFQAGTPKKLFKQTLVGFEEPSRGWDVTADGQKFLLVVPVESSQRPSFDVVLNWTAGLEKK